MIRVLKQIDANRFPYFDEGQSGSVFGHNGGQIQIDFDDRSDTATKRRMDVIDQRPQCPQLYRDCNRLV
jgi:arginyl-tRNA--protein-N-Asp/Glu arginylyltransferase